MVNKRKGGGIKKWKKMTKKEKLAILAGSAALAHAGYRSAAAYSGRLQHAQNVRDLNEWVERGKYEGKQSRQRKARMRFKYPPPRPRKAVKASRRPPKKAAPKVKPLVPRRMPLSGPAKRKQRVVSRIRRGSFELQKAKIATPGARTPKGPKKKLKAKTENISDMVSRLHQRALKMKKDTKADLVSTKVSVRRMQRKAGKKPDIGGSLSVGGKLNPWMQHVKAHKKKNPKHSHKQALIAAKKTYRKKSSGFGGKKK